MPYDAVCRLQVNNLSTPLSGNKVNISLPRRPQVNTEFNIVVKSDKVDGYRMTREVVIDLRLTP